MFQLEVFPEPPCPAQCTSHKGPHAMSIDPETLASEPNIHKCILAQTCNAPMGGVRPDVGEGVRLLGKSMGSYGKPETTRVR